MHAGQMVSKWRNKCFLGLSGTGKTILYRYWYISYCDDEHGNSDEGIFNFEGSHMKTFKLSRSGEPEILKQPLLLVLY